MKSSILYLIVLVILFNYIWTTRSSASIKQVKKANNGTEIAWDSDTLMRKYLNMTSSSIIDPENHLSEKERDRFASLLLKLKKSFNVTLIILNKLSNKYLKKSKREYDVEIFSKEVSKVISSSETNPSVILVVVLKDRIVNLYSGQRFKNLISRVETQLLEEEAERSMRVKFSIETCSSLLEDFYHKIELSSNSSLYEYLFVGLGLFFFIVFSAFGYYSWLLYKPISEGYSFVPYEGKEGIRVENAPESTNQTQDETFDKSYLNKEGKETFTSASMLVSQSLVNDRFTLTTKSKIDDKLTRLASLQEELLKNKEALVRVCLVCLEEVEKIGVEVVDVDLEEIDKLLLSGEGEVGYEQKQSEKVKDGKDQEHEENNHDHDVLKKKQNVPITCKMCSTSMHEACFNLYQTKSVNQCAYCSMFCLENKVEIEEKREESLKHEEDHAVNLIKEILKFQEVIEEKGELTYSITFSPNLSWVLNQNENSSNLIESSFIPNEHYSTNQLILVSNTESNIPDPNTFTCAKESCVSCIQCAVITTEILGLFAD